ncbi:hypothetical protein H0A36_30070 [Endozoicomonas sp. SM1973]|uniref:GxxExxY protein n=1 Tax=Spartinivicinus marinus TaxID=2994442 RepID=A0A853IEJ6_9GAMM|nr:hypothetical protein [Spartinivicinus marinus]MCX4030128.1 hypothetical protein [Spartinivicinus marinus]NYZ70262.1 hypothetical protein [Spartinivicinus marinus]
MDFINRLKGNLTETVVKALLVDEGYRVIDSGIEHLVRETTCLTQNEYLDLGFSDQLRKMPDFIVLNKEQTKSHLIEVKYRTWWDFQLIHDLREQVAFYKRIILVCVNAKVLSQSLA